MDNRIKHRPPNEEPAVSPVVPGAGSDPLRMLIAPNAFKNSIDAAGAATAIATGLTRSRLPCTCTSFPIGDGGDGTCNLIIRQSGGIIVPVDVHDAMGNCITASFGLIDGGHTAVIEMAEASGIRLLSPAALNPLRATSYGTGELIKAALDRGVKKIIIGMGGSATVDGGSGILSALGIRFLDKSGEVLPGGSEGWMGRGQTGLSGEATGPDEHRGPGLAGEPTRLAEGLAGLPEGLAGLASIDLSGLDKRIHTCEITVLCDVENKLLGPEGAVAVFAPQKGAGPQDLPRLEAALTRLAEAAFQQTGKDMTTLRHGGTAGGAAAGLHTFLNATLVNGIDYFLEIMGFDTALQYADIVITGEGGIDVQTLQGKGPYGVASRAKAKGLPVIGLAGRLPLEKDPQLQQYFDVLLAIGNEPTGLATALQATAQNLARTAEEIGNLLALGVGIPGLLIKDDARDDAG